MSSAAAPPEAEPIGYAGLVGAFDLGCPLPRQSLALAQVRERTRVADDRTEWLLLPRRSTITPPLRRIDHLGIALKHETVDLRVLGCLFAAGVEGEITEFIRINPRGRYTRRAWFLFEWMTGRELDHLT